jgi:hypothetical protein
MSDSHLQHRGQADEASSRHTYSLLSCAEYRMARCHMRRPLVLTMPEFEPGAGELQGARHGAGCQRLVEATGRTREGDGDSRAQSITARRPGSRREERRKGGNDQEHRRERTEGRWWSRLEGVGEEAAERSDRADCEEWGRTSGRRGLALPRRDADEATVVTTQSGQGEQGTTVSGYG